MDFLTWLADMETDIIAPAMYDAVRSRSGAACLNCLPEAWSMVFWQEACQGLGQLPVRHVAEG